MRFTITPPYLDPSSHEALYEVDVAMLEGTGHLKSGLDGLGEIAQVVEAREGVRA